jgi:hypothetical protein
VRSSLHQLLLGWLNNGQWDGWGMKHAWGRWEVHTEFDLKTWREMTTIQTGGDAIICKQVVGGTDSPAFLYLKYFNLI